MSRYTTERWFFFDAPNWWKGLAHMWPGSVWYMNYLMFRRDYERAT